MDQIITENRDGILRIEINRPDKKNALTAAMYQAMADALTAADADPKVRVVLIHGKSDLFTAGNDLQDFLDNRPRDEDRPAFQFLRNISRAQKPIVAAVAGAAVGIGTTMLLHCDLVYAAPNTRLQLPFVNLGLVPEAASSLLLPALVGYQRAAELLLLCEPFSAQTAKEIGLVNAVFPVASFREDVDKFVAEILNKSRPILIWTKRAIRASLGVNFPDSLRSAEVLYLDGCMKAEDAKEGIAAFMGKRKAVWKDK